MEDDDNYGGHFFSAVEDHEKTTPGPVYKDVQNDTNHSLLPPVIQHLEDNYSLVHLTDHKMYRSDIIEHSGVRYTLVALHIVAIVLGSLGNGLLISFIIRHRKRMRTKVTAYLVFNLAVCDFIKTTVHQPMRLVDILMPTLSEDYSQTTVYCQVTGFFSSFTACVAFHTIVAISQERLMLICYPLKAKTVITVGRIKKVLLFVWVTSFCVSLPLPILFTFVADIQLSQTNLTFCLIDVVPDSGDGRMYFILLFSLYYALPVVAISASYTKIFYTLNQTMCGTDAKDDATRRIMKVRKSLAKMMLCIAILFTIFEGPYFFTFLYICLGHVINHNPIFCLLVIESLPVISSGINPIIYTSHSSSLKKGLGTFLSGMQDSAEDGFHRRETFRSDVTLMSGGGSLRERNLLWATGSTLTRPKAAHL